MRKVAIVLSAFVILVLLAGCGGKAINSTQNSSPDPATTGQSGKYTNGSYYAEEANFSEKSGWKSAVALTVKDGNIVDIYWTALHKDGGIDKKVSSIVGAYGMKAKSDAASEWHEQAKLAEDFIIEKQDPALLAVGDDGKTDAISGVSVTVDDLTSLIDQALNAGLVEVGPYKDGHYFAEAAQFDEKSGWKENVNITILNGNIYAVKWNGEHKDGGTDKFIRSLEGEYGMVANSAATLEWHEQALLAEQYLLEKQDPKAIAVKDDGKTDAVSGVSITVSGFAKLVETALANAK